MSRLLYALPLMALVTACSLAPEHQRPVIGAGDGWRGQNATDSDDSTAAPVDRQWWTRFGSAELGRHVQAAHARNTDLEAALQRVAQARAGLRIAGADRLPAVSASGTLAKDWDRAFQSGTTDSDGWRGQASLSYEVDLFGRVANAVASARFRSEAATYAHEALTLVVEADVAQTYGLILAYNDRLRITRERLETAEEIYRIVEVRFREGLVSGLELAQQRTELANFRATLASIEEGRAQAINQLAVLTGEAPQAFAEPTMALDSFSVPQVTVLPPADLLTRRPDIRQSEARLKAANADIGVARAAFFPRLVIGGDSLLSASPVGAAVDTAAGVAASLSAPIFQGGRIAGGVDQSKAVRDELVADYRGTVLNAFREAEDALAALRATEQRLAAYGEAAQQARIAYDLSRDRFDAGSIDFLTLLDAQRSLLSAEDNLVQGRYDRMLAAVQMFRALGGGY